MEEKLIKVTDLENGLVLKLYDKSRKIAAERWLVCLSARIDIPVNGLLFENDQTVTVDEIKKALGESVLFEQKRDRNFIEDSRKDEVFKEVCVSFLSSSISYLSHPDFAKKFVFKKFKEYVNRRELGIRN
ncbi:hypothetical protein QUF72_04165 [Desulfobacterales bacterium HSG2]|nr:hypothetical protein [Desulfobacterales bacterium HSG2]